MNIQAFRNTTINLVKLSLPILGGNISHILINLADSIIAGRYSTVALGAISIATAIIMTATIGAIGLILSVTPVIANNRGENIPSKKYFKLTILFAILISIPFFLITKLLIYKINLFNLSPELLPPILEYSKIAIWTIFPAAIFVAVKEFLQAYEKVVFANVLAFFVVVLNIILNIIFAFGLDFNCIHIPEMGVYGLALATFVSRIVSVVLILIYCLPLFKHYFEYSGKFIKDLFKIGYPISLAMFFEFLGFNLTAILIGKFSALFAAVHNIILVIANISFMIFLSISSAASIKVGFYNGKNDKKGIIRNASSSLFLILSISVISFVIIGCFQNQIIQMFSNDAEVLFWAKKIIKFALAFLFFDAVQCGCVGILKGLKDTKIIMYAMFLAYLFIAIPFGSYFAFKHNLVLEGYWGGLALALFVIAVLMSIRVIFNIKKIK